MASRTMLSSSTNGNPPGPPRTPSLSSLSRQASIYSLTLEELQNAVNEPGKNFGSMNMDEFLKNIWTAEESQAMAAAMANVGEGNAFPGGLASQTSLQRQASLSLPRNLTGKTVDEVWRDIHRTSDQSAAERVQQRQLTMGEMTLEDFLAKAGVVRDDNEAGPSANNSSNSVVTHGHGGIGVAGGKFPIAGMQAVNVPTSRQAAAPQLDWMNYQLKTTSAALQHQQLLQQQHLLAQHQQQQQQQADAAAAFAGRLVSPQPVVLPPTTTANVLDMSFDGGMGLGPSSLSLSPAMLTPDTPTRGKKRFLEAPEEKSVEQRQKRMIKNRESAARSRARKQAYTVELEAEVTQLKEENSKLQQQQAEAAEKRRKQIMETLIPVTEQPQRPVRVLRRTRTASW